MKRQFVGGNLVRSIHVLRELLPAATLVLGLVLVLSQSTQERNATPTLDELILQNCSADDMLLTTCLQSPVLLKEFDVLGQNVPAERSSEALSILLEKNWIPEYYQPRKVVFYDVKPKSADRQGDILVITYVLGHTDEYNWSNYHWSFSSVVDTKGREITLFSVRAIKPEHLASTWRDSTDPPPMSFSIVPPSASDGITQRDSGWAGWELKLDSSIDGTLWDKVWAPDWTLYSEDGPEDPSDLYWESVTFTEGCGAANEDSTQDYDIYLRMAWPDDKLECTDAGWQWSNPYVTPDTWWHGSAYGGGDGYDYAWLCANFDASEFAGIYPYAQGAWLWAELEPIDVGDDVGLIVRLLSALDDTDPWTWRGDHTFRFDMYS